MVVLRIFGAEASTKGFYNTREDCNGSFAAQQSSQIISTYKSLKPTLIKIKAC